MRDDALLDSAISASEHGDFQGVGHPDLMEHEDALLQDAGLLDPGQPTPWSHYTYQRRLRREFSADERMQIRVALGLVDG